MMADAADDLDDLDALLDAPIQKSVKHDDKHADKNGHSQSDSRDNNGEESVEKSKSRDDERRHRRSSRDRDDGERRADRSSRRRSSSRDRHRRRSRSRSPHSRKRDRRSRSRERSRRDRRSRSRSPRERGGSRRSRSPRDRRGRDRSVDPAARRSKSPERPKTPETAESVEERDARTVFIMQLSQRARARDVEEFFSAVGKIRDIKMIICNRTRRFKGIAYVEFDKIEAVPLAMGLNGQKLLGVPIIVQPSQAEKNRMASTSMPVNTFPNRPKHGGPARLYIGSLHYHITEDMVRSIFEPFGPIQSLQLIMEPGTTRSRGYGFLTFVNVDDANKAAEQMNGFDLAGRPMKVSQVTDKAIIHPGVPAVDSAGGGPFSGSLPGVDLTSVSEDRNTAGAPYGGFGISERLALMGKLSAGKQATPPSATGPPVPVERKSSPESQAEKLASLDPPVATPCFQLSNMFAPREDSKSNAQWDAEMAEIRDDVLEECSKYGSIVHVHVDKASTTGVVYVKCANVPTALASVNALHGRWFSGNVIKAAYIPLVNYHNLFADAVAAVEPLKPISR